MRLLLVTVLAVLAFPAAAPAQAFTLDPGTLNASDPTPKEGEPVTFTSTASSPVPGDTLTYHWDFGDGNTQVTASPSVTHVYTVAGGFDARAYVTDLAGLRSDDATTLVVVRDGTPPGIAISAPARGSKLRLNPRKRHPSSLEQPRPLPMTVLGLAGDSSGVAAVDVAITRTGSSCRQYSGRRFKRAGCGAYHWASARLVGAGWVLTTRRLLRVPAGRYAIRARATDGAGNTATTGPVRVRVR